MGINIVYHSRPRIVISKCLGFDHCRYNGDMVRAELVERLKDHVDFIPVCPEVEIGLGVPRRPIRVVSGSGIKQLVQPATEKDVASEMNDFVDSFLDNVGEIDGFILKSRSPSCGLYDVKYYAKIEKSPVIEKGSGFFGEAVKNRYGQLAVEDEARLLNPKIREHFLTKLFTLARFRTVKKTNSIKPLMDFHANNKYLFMAYNQAEMRQMGKLIGTQKGRSLDEVFLDYQEHLYNVFNKGPKFSSYVNVLHHTFGYVSKYLSSEEKAFFLDMGDMYVDDRTPLSTCLTLIRSWVVRFDVEYLANQTIFEPYPFELGETFDTDRWRNFWK
jgi:uncharacterized protein YbgA (DUF1722 family)/uncharacterized protein YbbK (DUF523 family)